MSGSNEQQDSVTPANQLTADWASLMDYVEDAIYTVDLENRVLRANKAFYAMTGRTPENTVGRNIVEIMHPEGEEHPCPVCAARDSRRDAVVIMEKSQPGSPLTKPFEITVKMVRDGHEQVQGVLMRIRDISEQRRTEAELRLAAGVFESASEGILIFAADQTVQRANPAFEALTGFKTGELVGRSLDSLLDCPQPCDGCDALTRVEEDGKGCGETWLVRAGQPAIPVIMTVGKVVDEDGVVDHYVATCTDIDERYRAERRIEHLAHHDALTGLPNRLSLYAVLKERLAKQSASPFALVFADLDKLKAVNDQLGHAMGDRYLEVLAKRLRHNSRQQDQVFRVGGDEFILLLDDLSDRDQAAAFIDNLLGGACGRPIVFDGHEVQPGCSLGIALYPQDATDADSLIQGADTAMYVAKRSGGSQYRFVGDD